MKSNLHHGKIPTPISIYAAKARHRQLVYEIDKIEARIDDAFQVTKFPERGGYDVWRRRATAALGYLREEAKQLAEWILVQPECRLLEEAWEVLARLRDEVDLDPEELAVVARLDVHFGAGANAVRGRK